MRIPVILIFDVGKTNKKLLLFDEDYKIVHEQSVQLTETKDEDGFPCEDVFALTNWVKENFQQIANDPRFEVKAVNFSAYGATFVYLDEHLRVIPPLYNYLKPYSEPLLQKFYDTYGGKSEFSKITASPVLGNLNSGMQLYRLKWEKPGAFQKIKYALHLPQYLSFVLSSSLRSDITSIGCHTNLWDFKENKYHHWVKVEGLLQKFPNIIPCSTLAGYANNDIPIGGGLHDSSAALIPYLSSFHEPFVLLSTGTWCISLNPFNHTLLSDTELEQDCLCYLSYDGKPVKASRLFSGHEHKQQAERLAAHFDVNVEHYNNIRVDFELLNNLKKAGSTHHSKRTAASDFEFAKRDLTEFRNYEQAYHCLIADLIAEQIQSTDLVLKGTSVRQIFVDGGFSSNSIYMHTLGEAYSDLEVYAASVPQASGLGAALAIHEHWNSKSIRSALIDLKPYSHSSETSA